MCICVVLDISERCIGFKIEILTSQFVAVNNNNNNNNNMGFPKLINIHIAFKLINTSMPSAFILNCTGINVKNINLYVFIVLGILLNDKALRI